MARRVALRYLLVGVVLTTWFITFPRTVSAQYLDPGAGSMVVQLLAAGLVGVAAVLKVYWGRIKQWLSRAGKPRADPSDPGEG